MKLVAIVTLVAVVSFGTGWILSQSNAVAVQHQVEADAILSDALDLLKIVESGESQETLKDEILTEVGKKVIMARTLPHKVSELKGHSIVALCALIDRAKSGKGFGNKLEKDKKGLALINEYLNDVETEAQSVAQRYRSVLPRGTCGI